MHRGGGKYFISVMHAIEALLESVMKSTIILLLLVVQILLYKVNYVCVVK